MKRSVACLAALLVFVPAAALAGSPGLLDKTFGTGGTAELRVAAQHTVQCCFVVVDRQGRLLLTGNDVYAGSSRVFVQRLLPSGAPDTSYGTGGRVLLPAVKAAASLVLVRPQLLPGGGLEVLSQARQSFESPSRLVLDRLTADGSADASFGTGGRTVSPAVYSPSFISPFAVGADGTTTVAAADGSGTWSRVRYDPHGAAVKGRTPLDLGAGDQVVWSLAVDAKGRTTVLGDTSPGGCAGTTSTVLRVLPDGRPDASFGTGGRATYQPGASASYVTLVPLADGGYLLGDGVTYDGTDFHALLLRTDSRGHPLVSFGGAGRTQVGTGFGSGTIVRDGAITQPVFGPSGGPSAVFRLDLATGSVVRSFGDHGRIPLSLTPAGMDDWGSVAVDGKGRVVVAAGVDPGANSYDTRALVRRWLPAAGAAVEPVTARGRTADGVRAAPPQRPGC